MKFVIGVVVPFSYRVNETFDAREMESVRLVST